MVVAGEDVEPPSLLDEAFEPVPGALFDWTCAGVDKAHFFQCVVHPTEVARSAGDHQIVDAAIATSGMRENVIELQPHRHKRGVFCSIGSASEATAIYSCADNPCWIARCSTGPARRR